MLAIYALMIAVLLGGCSSGRSQAPLSYEGEASRARSALEKNHIFEARQWAAKALEEKPKNLEAQKLMAKVIDHETEHEKILSRPILPEELSSREKTLQVKTWLERSQEALRINEFEEALSAAEQVFRMDPENQEASRLVDSIKEKARRQGRDESLFLRGVYQQEIEQRIQRYTKQAETWIGENKLGVARLVVEKILLLDPRNPQGHRLLALLDKKDEAREAF